MRGCRVPIRRAAGGMWVLALLLLLAALPPAAHADANARGYRPVVNNISVVVTTDQVYVTWTDPPGVQPTHVFAYRGDCSACPTGATDGAPFGNHSVTKHLIDSTVQAGLSYCSTVFVTYSYGILVTYGRHVC